MQSTNGVSEDDVEVMAFISICKFIFVFVLYLKDKSLNHGFLNLMNLRLKN
jgi:hypothetical protein